MPALTKASPQLTAKVVTDYLITQNYCETARRMKLAESTVRYWVGRELNQEALARICAEKKREYLIEAWDVELEVIDELRSRVPRMEDRDLIVFYGVHDDKRTRASGEATERIETRGFQLQINASGAIVAVPASSESDQSI